jgi:hypothetical protein
MTECVSSIKLMSIIVDLNSVANYRLKRTLPLFSLRQSRLTWALPDFFSLRPGSRPAREIGV